MVQSPGTCKYINMNPYKWKRLVVIRVYGVSSVRRRTYCLKSTAGLHHYKPIHEQKCCISNRFSRNCNFESFRWRGRYCMSWVGTGGGAEALSESPRCNDMVADLRFPRFFGTAIKSEIARRFPRRVVKVGLHVQCKKYHQYFRVGFNLEPRRIQNHHISIHNVWAVQILKRGIGKTRCETYEKFGENSNVAEALPAPPPPELEIAQEFADLFSLPIGHQREWKYLGHLRLTLKSVKLGWASFLVASFFFCLFVSLFLFFFLLFLSPWWGKFFALFLVYYYFFFSFSFLFLFVFFFLFFAHDAANLLLLFVIFVVVCYCCCLLLLLLFVLLLLFKMGQVCLLLGCMRQYFPPVFSNLWPISTACFMVEV